ncbi:MAG TPA: L,D-transpeptidase family protein, partial [Azospirillum sp.]
REGDGATPVGVWALRRVLWRPDRLARPDTALPTRPIAPDDGWCDDPADPAYNRPVTRPYPAGHESLWRDDSVYDIIVVLGHNDDPVVPGLGSAVFLHVARPDWEPTAGCVALELADLLRLLKDCGPDTALRVVAP